MADYGISTLGIELWAAESTNGNKITTASAYSRLNRINAIGEMSLEPESIDASALEDYVSRFVAGRGSVSDTYTITVNLTNDTLAEWTELLGKKVCFLTKIPGVTKQIFVIATVPAKLPVSGIEQNGLFTVEINCTTNDFIGFDTAVTGLSEVSSITLNEDTASIAVNEVEHLSATTVPAGKSVVWASSDPTIARVTEDGIVIGMAAGTATITASNGAVSDTCAVTVTSA